MVKKAYGLLMVIIIVALCCVGLGFSEFDTTLALVGKTAIPKRDVSFRVKVEHSYDNYAVSNEVALISLINDTVEYEIARSHGVEVTREEIVSFRKHVDESSKEPEILKKVKRAFSEDQDSYERIFLAPKILNRKLRYFHSRNHEIQRQEKESIELAFRLVARGESFEKVALRCGLKSSTFDIEDKEADVIPELKKYIPHGPTPSKISLITIVETLSAGEVYKNIVEDDFEYMVIRLKEKKGNHYFVETIMVSKKSFDEWLRKEATKIRIEILDANLETSIRSKYPGIRWLEN
jgi:hypothetical protein